LSSEVDRGMGRLCQGIHHLLTDSLYAVRAVLRLRGELVDHLFDAVLADELKVLPDDLAALDVLLDSPDLMETLSVKVQALKQPRNS